MFHLKGHKGPDGFIADECHCSKMDEKSRNAKQDRHPRQLPEGQLLNKEPDSIHEGGLHLKDDIFTINQYIIEGPCGYIW